MYVAVLRLICFIDLMQLGGSGKFLKLVDHWFSKIKLMLHSLRSVFYTDTLEHELQNKEGWETCPCFVI